MPLDRSAPGAIPVAVKLGWSFGSAGQITMLYLANLILMYFMVTQLGMAPALAGALLLAGRIYDSVVDLPLGLASDRIDTPWGRRRPWMAAGAALSFFGILAVFISAFPSKSPGAVLQFAGGMLLFYTGYSFFSVPSTAMAAEMTDDADERTSLMAYRTLFFQLGGLFGAAGLPALIGALGGNRLAYAKTAVLAAAFVLVSMLTSVLATRNTQRVQRSAPPVAPKWAYAKALMENRPFFVLLGVKFAIFTASASSGAAALFFIRTVLDRDERWMGLLQLTSNAAGLVLIPFWRWLARRLGKGAAFSGAVVVSGLTGLTWFLATPHESNVVFVLRAVVLGVGSVGTVLMTLAVLPDTMMYDAHKTGLRREGLYSGLYEFFTKTAFAFGPFLIGLYLSANGFKAGAVSAAAQSAQAVGAVRVAMSVIPFLAYGCALLLILCNRKAWRLSAAAAAAGAVVAV